MRVYATTEQEPHNENEQGNAYVMFSNITPEIVDPSAGEISVNYFYLKNLSSTNLFITTIRFWAQSAEYIDLYINPIGNTVGGIDITPSNANLGSGNLANGIFQHGEQLSGLSGGTFFDRFRIAGDDDDHIYRPDSKLIIPRNASIMFQAGTGGINIETTIEFYYHIIE